MPEAILFTSSVLTEAEYEQVKIHPVLGAQITDEVLTAEQVRWIREGLQGPLTREGAVAELHRCSGTQFDADLVHRVTDVLQEASG